LIGTYRAERDTAVSRGNARDIDAGDPRVHRRCRANQRAGTQRHKTTRAPLMSTSSHVFPPRYFSADSNSPAGLRRAPGAYAHQSKNIPTADGISAN